MESMVLSRPKMLSVVALIGLVAGLLPAVAVASPPDFQFEIRPILSKNCFACHGPDEAHRQADLRLDARETAVELGAIVPGDPDASELIRRITSEDVDERMPPAESGLELSAAEIDQLKRWIASGAEYAKHWSYEPPQRPELPEVSRPEWCRNDIDRFVLARLDSAALKPEPEANRYELVRRLSLDLIGLPPTLNEVEDFVSDNRFDAYERLVDRLLRSSAYGEHWARKWLDLARYADTTGYEQDSKRTIWPYRDWVINALNADMPFDRFTIEQLAGDMLPEATKDQIIATAFHRNTMQNDEGGTDNEEYRVAAVIDRVNTTMQVWMGSTMGCCQCHSHKYDPFSHREYYQMFAFFNQTADADRYDQEPLLSTPSPQQQALKNRLEEELKKVQDEYNSQVKELTAAQRAWEQAVVGDFDWRPVRLTEVHSRGGATCTILDDGSVLVSGERPKTDTYSIRGHIELDRVTAVRLEALPHESLPEDGPGRADDGNFAISKIQLHQEPIRPAENVKYVHIELPRHDYLTMSEVQVFRGDENVALGKSATQSSTAYEGWAKLAIDGSTHPHFATGRSISHTAFDANPWWEVDLGEPTRVDRISIWNEDAHPYRLAGAVLTLLDRDRNVVWRYQLRFSPNLTATIIVDDASPQFARAGADSERKSLAAAHAIEYQESKSHGWSPEARSDGAHELILGLEAPIEKAAANPLRFVIDQQTRIEGRDGQLLGRFRLYVTDSPAAATAAAVPQPIRRIAQIPPDDRTSAQTETLSKYYQSTVPGLTKLVEQQEDLRRRLSEELRIDKTPIMKELPPEERRTTRVFNRGSFLNPGEEVTPSTPDVFPPLPADAPRNRLGLARWLVDRQNPLTARVTANREWEQLFGAGIVLTSEDFGSQGMLPSHPELLDWLAVELMEQNWSLKRLIKTIVMSAAYRQSSRISAEKLARDPDNRLISRGPRVRLTAEQIRDQALAVSGLLSRKIGGPSVMPPQPEGVWQVVYSNDRWVTSEGEDRYRRGLYTFWRRTSPYPSAMALDATSRETCTIRRITTNTPIAAFALLNDPVYIEAAQALALRIVESDKSEPAALATYAFRRVLGRPPRSDEVDRLVDLYQSELAHYQQDADAAKAMATSELDTFDSGHNMAELAAWTVVANVLLNLDETLSN
jgi:hypothetical protein